MTDIFNKHTFQTSGINSLSLLYTKQAYTNLRIEFSEIQKFMYFYLIKIICCCCGVFFIQYVKLCNINASNTYVCF